MAAFNYSELNYPEISLGPKSYSGILISQGTYGKVYQINDREVVKELIVNQAERYLLDNLLIELQILANYYHPYIIKMKRAHLSFLDNQLCCQIILPKGEPFRRTGNQQVDLILLQQLITGLAALQDSGFLYSDIKTSNIVLVNGITQLIDFGNTCLTEKDIKSKISYSSYGDLSQLERPAKIDPDCSAEISDSDEISRAMFSLGITVIMFLTGKIIKKDWETYYQATFESQQFIKQYRLPLIIDLLLLRLLGPAKQRARCFRSLPVLITDFRFIELKTYPVPWLTGETLIKKLDYVREDHRWSIKFFFFYVLAHGTIKDDDLKLICHYLDKRIIPDKKHEQENFLTVIKESRCRLYNLTFR